MSPELGTAFLVNAVRDRYISRALVHGPQKLWWEVKDAIGYHRTETFQASLYVYGKDGVTEILSGRISGRVLLRGAAISVRVDKYMEISRKDEALGFIVEIRDGEIIVARSANDLPLTRPK